ncbi:MAG: hypothetical protein ACRD3N_10000, partial [Terracidiphilus sp.]
QKRLFTSFLPAVSAESMKRMRRTVRGWRIHRQTPATLADLAKGSESGQTHLDFWGVLTVKPRGQLAAEGEF